jgi:hypothetical protein
VEENGDQIAVQQCLPPPNRWVNRGSKSEFGKLIKEYCWREAQIMGFGVTPGKICLQQLSEQINRKITFPSCLWSKCYKCVRFSTINPWG